MPIRVLLVLMILASPSVLLAGPETADPDVETVVVQAPRPAATTGGAGVIEAAIDSLPLPAAPSVAEALRELPLLHVRTNSRGESEISARGSESRQVAVLVDGIPITLAWDARADVSVIPATALGGLRYTRGLSSILDGPNVLGGVIEVDVARLRETPAESATQLTVGTDDLGAFGATVTTMRPVHKEGGAWLLRGGLGFRDSPGDPLARGVEETATDDGRRLNTDFESVDGFASLRYRANGGAWGAVSASAFRRERGIAAELGLPDDEARLWRYPLVSRALVVMSGGTGLRPSLLGGVGDVEVSLGVDVGRTEIDAYTSRAYDEIVDFENAKDRTLTARLLADQTLGDRGDLRVAATHATVDHDEILPEGTFDYRQELLSLGVETDWRLLTRCGALERLVLSVGGAYDRACTPRTGGRDIQPAMSEPGGRAGLSAAFSNGDLVLHAGASRRGRFPALRELYSGALNRFLPNPDLKPERLTTFETGVTKRIAGGTAQAVVFRNELEDAVVRIKLDDGTGRYMRVNRDRLETTGLELVLVRGWGPVELSASGTLQSVDLIDTSTDQVNRPENLPEIFGSLGVRVRPGHGLTARVRATFTGEQYAINGLTGEDAELAGRAVVDVSLSRSWPLRGAWAAGAFSSLETRIAVDNLGDVALYDAWGLPEPGRRIGFEVRLR